MGEKWKSAPVVHDSTAPKWKSAPTVEAQPKQRSLESELFGAINDPMLRFSKNYESFGKDKFGSGVGMVNSVAQRAAAPLAMADALLRRVPVVGEPVSKGLQAVGEAIAYPFQKAAGGVMDLLSKDPTDKTVPFVPQFLRGENYPKQKAEVEELVGTAGQFIVPEAIVKGVPKAIGATARTIFPNAEKHLYNVAGKFDVPTFEAREAVIKRGLKENVGLGGGYARQEGLFKKIQSQKNSIFNKDYSVEIAKMDDAGLGINVREVADNAVQWVKEHSPDLAGPDRAKFEARLDDLAKGFVEDRDVIVKPTEMQKIKSAVHSRIPYDEMGSVNNEFNKAIAQQFRTKLEEWNPRLGELNKRWSELNTISQSVYEEALGSGKKLPTGATSAPFYLAIAEPVRGTALSFGRSVVKSPFLLSRTALTIDKLKNIDKPAVQDALSPPFSGSNVGEAPVSQGGSMGVKGVNTQISLDRGIKSGQIKVMTVNGEPQMFVGGKPAGKLSDYPDLAKKYRGVEFPPFAPSFLSPFTPPTITGQP